MKKYLSILACAVLLTILISSCKKDKTHLQGMPPTTSAFLKVVHAAPGFRSVFNMPDSINIFIGGQRIFGANPTSNTTPATVPATPFTYNSAFPSNTTNTYAAVPTGSQDIRLVARGSVNIDSVTIAIIPKSLNPGWYYTLVITDSIATTPDYSKIWAVDNFIAPEQGKYLIRCINAVMNDTAGKKIDVYSFRNGANIFTNMSPGDVSGFSTFNIPASAADSFSVRRAGTTFELARLNTVSITNNSRIYTLLYRGDGRLTSGTRARGIVVYTNR
jgi:hypothetical protein